MTSVPASGRWRVGGRRHRAGVAIAAVLTVLLSGLAALQWRWVGQLRDVERERLQSTLRARASQAAQEVDRELTRAFFWLQPEPPRPGEGSELRLAPARLARWFQVSPHPGLVREIYVLEGDGPSLPKLTRFDRAACALVAAAWPPELERWRAPIEAAVLDPRPTAPNRGGADGQRRAAVPTIDPSVPALLVRWPFVRYLETMRGAAIEVEYRTGFTLVLLDGDYIRRELLPAAVSRHFPADEGFDVHVAIVDRNGEPVYESEPGAAAAAAARPDARAGVFAIRFGEFGRFVLEAGPAARGRESRTDAPAADLGKPADAASGEAGGDDGRRLAEGPAGDAAAAPRTGIFALNLLRRPGEEGRGGRPRALGTSVDPAWTLVVRHRAGSLDAAVGAVRLRNLAVSFGALLLVAAGVAFVLASARRAERLAQQQIEFVAGVSHELRTPLAVIRSAGENLADGVVADSRQVQRYGALIAREGRRLTEMVEQVMEFAGMEAGRTTREHGPTAMPDVVRDVLRALEPVAREAGVVIDAHVAGAVPPVWGDRLALVRAVQNLVSNAIKYGGEAKWVGVEIDVRTGRAGREVVVAVHDRGPGIPAAERGRIFEPFYRGADAVAAQVHGSGLGLSLVRRIAEEHGGAVEVESEVGRGSTFSLVLPALREAPATEAPAAEG
jgi:signal transduction histidine kinase